MSCQFEGALDGRGVHSFQGSVERAGTTPYLLLGVRVDDEEGAPGGRWILDLTAAAGVSLDGPGRVRLTLTMVAPDGLRLKGPALIIIREHDGTLLIDDLQAELLDPRGRVHRLQGRARWVPPRPQVGRVEGTLQLQLDERALPPTPATFLPFGEGWQAQVVVPLEAGETISAQIEIPSLDEGQHTAPGADLGLSTTRLDDDLHVDVLTLQSLQLRVTREGEHLSVRGQAHMDGGTVRVHFHGTVQP